MDDRSMDALLKEQEGLITWEQLHAAGWTRSRVRWALSHRGWRAVLPHVISTTGSDLHPRQRLVAAVLLAGPDSVISSMTAAAWHGVTAAAGDPRVHVAVPMARHPRSSGYVVIHRTRHPDPHAWGRGGLTISSRPRAVVEAAREIATVDGACEIVAEAVERRLVRAEDLRHELEIGPVNGSRRVRRAVQSVERGAWSVPEARLLEVLDQSTVLPRARANVRLTAEDGLVLPTPDAWIDEAGLAIQVHSRRWHADGLDWERTVAADGVFAEYGVIVVAVTPQMIRDRPSEVLGRVERAFLSAQRRPRPAIVSELR